MQRALITGGAGFIGSNLADRLVRDGVDTVVLDNFRTGRRAFIEHLEGNPRFTLIEGDVLDEATIDKATAGCDVVFHLQANADVRHGLEHPTVDLELNALATLRVLEAMRNQGVRRIVFSSTGSIYGESEVVPTPENAPFPIQTSLYGASKLAAEGSIGAYVNAFGFSGVICRFVSILGERYTHGHVVDFFSRLRQDPGALEVLGDGRQEKSYLYVGDCVEAMLLTATVHADDAGVFVYNLGTDETIVVDDSVELITKFLGVSPTITHTGGRRGWPGDSPLIWLDTKKLRSLGWTPALSIREAITRTLEWLEANEHVVSSGVPEVSSR